MFLVLNLVNPLIFFMVDNLVFLWYFSISDQYSEQNFHNGGGGGNGMTPSGSPLVSRRMNRDTSSVSSSMTQDSDVFSRLTSNMSNQVEYR